MYSQNAEESFILAYFDGRPPARFLDVGAYDGKTFSNTYALFERGWSGVCVEPDPQALEKLRETHGDNPGITIVDAAVCEFSGVVEFHNSRSGGVSTTIRSHRDKWASAATFETIDVAAISPAVLLRMYPGPYAFFNLDVEGNSAAMLEHFPLSDMGVELVCCEYDNREREVEDYCALHGLENCLHRNGENLIIGK